MLTKKYDFIKSKFKALFYEDYWNVGVVDTDITSFLQESKPDVKWLSLIDKSEFIADPFAITDTDDKSKIHIFFEVFSYDEVKGRIGYILWENGTVKNYKYDTVIDEIFHLAYPYIFHYEDEKYIIPESSDDGGIHLYKADKFPDSWSRVSTLITNFAGIDNTIINYNDLWWLFTTDKTSGEHSHLHLYYADDLFSEWHPHKNNPVKIDNKSARCAGTPFLYNGNLIRPSMDCSKTYGKQIVLNKVLQLTKTQFKEEAVKIIRPYSDSDYGDKIHTIAKVGDYTIVDGAKEVFILTNWVLFKCKLKRIWSKYFN